MSFDVTISLLAAAAIAAVISLIGLRRPREFGRIWAPPYHFILFVSILVMIVMAAHLVSLVSGRPFLGRSGV